MPQEYAPKEELKPNKLIDISQDQIDDHWKLYRGYVKQVNTLSQELLRATDSDKTSLPFADRRRRYGFELNGMVLHELYFENMKPNVSASNDSKLATMINDHWGNTENWLADFKQAGKSRGIGWSILYADPSTGNLFNTYVSDHEYGHVSSYKPLLVMDIWEHAYMVDHKSGGRGDYIDAFCRNIHWDVVEKRFEKLKI